MSHSIFISYNTKALDVFIWKKSDTVYAESKRLGVPLNRIITIGDGHNDLDMLKIPGQFAVGCPANAQPEIKAYISSIPNGIVSEKEELVGFIDVLEQVKQMALDQNILLNELMCFTDKDGVLYADGNYEPGKLFAPIIRLSGIDWPRIKIITGSDLQQNTKKFMPRYGLSKDNLQDNIHVKSDPYLVLPEQGALEVNVLDHSNVRNIAKQELNNEFIELFINTFKPLLITKIEQEVFSKFEGLVWESDFLNRSKNKHGVYIGKKQAMISVDTPYVLRFGHQDNAKYGQLLIDCAVKVAEELGMDYKVLG